MSAKYISISEQEILINQIKKISSMMIYFANQAKNAVSFLQPGLGDMSKN